MAKGDRVAAGENLIRFIDEEDWDGLVVNGSAFERDPKDWDGVSVTRMKMYNPISQERDLAEIRAILLSRNIPLSEGFLAVINAGDIEHVGIHYSIALAVHESPSKKKKSKLANPAHAIIKDVPFVGQAQADAVADRLGLKVSAVYGTVLP